MVASLASNLFRSVMVRLPFCTHTVCCIRNPQPFVKSPCPDFLMSKLSMADAYCRIWDADFQNLRQLVESVQNSKAAMSVHRGFAALFYMAYGTIGTHREGFAALAFPSRGFDWCYRINCLRNIKLSVHCRRSKSENESKDGVIPLDLRR